MADIEPIAAERRGPLAPLRVLVSGRGRASVTVGALLADYGAEVAVLEPPEGHPLRGHLLDGSGRSLSWAAIARNLTSVVAEPATSVGEEQARGLVAAADVLVVDPSTPFELFGPAELAGLRARLPRLVILAVSPFGLTGPRSGLAGSDVVAEAVAGLAHITGDPAREPLHSDYPVATAVTGLFGALSVLTALRARDRADGEGCLIDLASVDAVVRILDFIIAFQDQIGLVSERANSTSDYQVPVNRWQTGDGRWMSFTGNTNDIVLRFFRAMNRPELCDDERFNTNLGRVANKAALEEIITRWFAAHTRADIDAAMTAERVPIATIVSMEEIFAEEQFQSRGVIVGVDTDSGPVRMPNVAMRFSRTAGVVRHIGPALGADTDAILASWRPDPEVAGAEPDRIAATSSSPWRGGDAAPLAGLRVLDIGNVIAGPLSATLLADLGADVVKVERPGTGDLFRGQAPQKDGGSVWWRVVGRGKRSIALNLKDPDDRDTFYDLVRAADVVVENMVPGVVASLGVDYESLRKINPTIVGVSISGYGQDGPMSRRPAFGRNAEAYSGMAYMTGYPGDLPQHTGFPVADSFSALLAAFGALVALRDRDASEDHAGQHVDVALFESVFRFMEPQVALYDQRGEVWKRGRAATDADLWRRVVPTADGAWVTISTGPDTDLAAVASWTGLSTAALLAGDPSIDVWSRTFTATALEAAAVEAGIPAALDATALDLLVDPHLDARQVLTTQIDPEIGEMVMPAVIPVFDGERPIVARPAPLLDAHRAEILSEWCPAEQEASHG